MSVDPSEQELEDATVLESVFNLSRKIGEEIEKRHRTFQQLGHPQRTEQVATEAGKSLTNLWHEFCDYHREIERLCKNKEDQAYFVDNYYSFVEAKMRKMEANIIKVLPEFKITEKCDATLLETPEPEIEPTDARVVKKLTIERKMKLSMLRRIIEKILDANIDDVGTDDIEFMLKQCEREYEIFVNAHTALMCCVSTDLDKPKLAEEFENTEDAYRVVFVTLNNGLSKKRNFTFTEWNTSNDNPFGNGRPNMYHDNVKLPQIKIPTFDGDYTRWPEFRDLFSSLIHEKANVPKVQKLQYLKSNLTGTAAGVIKHLQVNAAHYDAAWEALNKRFNNKRLLVTNNLKRLMTQKHVQNESAEELRVLLDTTKEIVCTLENLGECTSMWNSIIVFIVSQRLPPQTTELWENLIAKNNCIPPFDELESFLENRFRTIEMIDKKLSYNNNRFKNRRPQRNTNAEYKSFAVEESKKQCALCKSAHEVFACSEFKKMTPEQRLSVVKKMKLCTLCLSSSHANRDCKKEWSCFKCKKRHNTQLHLDEKNESVVNNASTNNVKVLLATAIIRMKAADGSVILCRALIDQGSMTSIVTDDIASRLRLSRTYDDSTIRGISGNVEKTRGRSLIEFRSRFDGDSPSFTANALILKKITSWIPRECMHMRDHFNYLSLADPSFDAPGKIDVLLGADIYQEIILDHIHKDILLAQNTHLGWILSGSVNDYTRKPVISSPVCHTITLEQQLKQFWEIEEKATVNNKWTLDEQECEQFYIETTTRSSDGRYVVRLPFKKNKQPFGRSRHIAVSNLLNLEKKFRKNPALKERYTECMLDYFQTGHAVPAEKPENYYLRRNNDEITYDCYYFPHLAIMKEDSSSTKTRVVFDASRKSSNGVSLNDNLLIGPTIQPDVVEKIFDFRLRRYAFTCDIAKMYRQIKSNEIDWPYQRFVWRENENEAIKDFCLTTVTFGEASAPFSAIRTIEQLAKDNADEFPLAADILFNKCYVDDVHQGSDTIEHAVKSRDEVIRVTNSAGFDLRKWASNDPAILLDLPSSHLEVGKQIAVDAGANAVKTLGLYWNTDDDTFQFKCSKINEKASFSKRELLASIAKIYDPAGWMQPLIVVPKILMQSTWKREIGWDDPLPNDIHDNWAECIGNLGSINTVKIPRWIGYSEQVKKCELHGFCDASQKAYGAAVYIRMVHENDTVSTGLLIAKSRVAPIKKIVTIPRLELCGATLLCELFEKIASSLHIDNLEMYGWSDSQAVLGWLKEPSPNRWKAFVKHRVIEICNTVNSKNWNYVNTKENPADLVSRGCSSSDLNSLWWKGPEWLPAWSPSEENLIYTTDEEIAEKPILTHTVAIDASFLEKYSSYDKACRIVAWMLRFAKNCRKTYSLNKTRCLTEEEIEAGKTAILKLMQEDHYSRELSCLRQKDGAVEKSSKLYSLCPFIDNKGLLRVGGRLENADLPFDSKHPIIFPPKCTVTRPMIFDFHRRSLHGGITATLNSIRSTYWLPQGAKTVKSTIDRCVRCARNKPKTLDQLMGQLPPSRVNVTKPFYHTGVDFAGPIYIKTRAGKGAKAIKAYVSIFVCMATKAVHIELVGALTSTAFIAAFRRFISRRGIVMKMFSDNGSNFKGAFRQFMKEWDEFIADFTSLEEDVENFLVSQKIEWHFIPAVSPNFGGLWESNVKSLKHYVRRTVGKSILTYEEMITVLAQVENMLNSRPLCPLTDNIEDLNALTPNHFLTGRAFIPMPEKNHLDEPEYQLTRWQLCQRKYQEICSRFKSEYLNRLQQRPKWAQINPNIRVGQMFLIKDENKLANRWTLGRVLAVHPGTDGLVRVATLRTECGIYKRPITKLSPLPIDVPYTEAAANVDLLPIVQSDEIIRKPNEKSNENKKSTQKKKPGKKPIDMKSTDGKPPPQTNLRRSPRFAKPNVLLSALFALCMATLAFGKENITITPLAHPAGMHFKSEGSAYLYTTHWNYIVQHNIDDLTESMHQIYDNIIALNFTCDSTIINCNTHIDSVLSAHQRMTYQFNSTFLTVKRRGKRHPVAVGVVAVLALVGAYRTGKDIFQYFKGSDLDEFKLQQMRVIAMLGDHHSMLNSSAHILDEVESDIVHQINEINSTFAQTDLMFHRLQAEYKFMEILANIQRDISHLRDIYSLAINSLIRRPSLLSAIDVLNITNADQHFREISASLPESHQLPRYTVLDEILYQPSIKVIGRTIQFIFEIPVVQKRKALAYQLISIPVIHEENMLWVQASTQYIAIDYVNSSISEFHSLKFDKQCTIIGNSNVCRMPLHPRNDNEQLRCETDLFSMNSLPPTCAIHKTTKADVWIPISDNIWGFVIANVTEMEGKNLTGSGLMTFGNQTIDSTNSTIIISDGLKTIQITSPSFNLSALSNGRPLILRHQFNPEINQHITELHKKIEDVSRAAKEFDIHDLHHYTSPYLLFIVVIIFLYCRSNTIPIVVDHSRFFQQRPTYPISN